MFSHSLMNVVSREGRQTYGGISHIMTLISPFSLKVFTESVNNISVVGQNSANVKDGEVY